MKRIYSIFGFAAALSLNACHADVELKQDATKAKAALVGVWQGDGSADDEGNYSGLEEYWKITRTADGRFEQEYLSMDMSAKKYTLALEKGAWDYEGGMYVETHDDGQSNSFRVISITENTFQYNFPQDSDDYFIEEGKTDSDFELIKPPPEFAKAD
ncbi:lipocalin family protein [Hahella chejuensis]|nr:lipocalin family protein [Hahella chejuensis]